MLDLAIQNQQKDFQVPAEELLTKWAAAAISNDKDVQVTLRIVDAEESQELNRDYRGKDKSTNVLSFPMDMPEELATEFELNLLGDLVVCASVVDQESRQQNKSLKAHWAHMLVHGMLHLQGYDHIDDADAEEMEELEVSILNQLGFENPYRSETE